jgi:hypothetical protein
MATKTKKKSKGLSSGLSPRMYSGLSKKRMEKGQASNRLILKQGKTQTVQFLDTPDEMKEFDMHQFQDGGKWNYVPCAGDDCPLCEDDDPDVARTRYRFICNVYSFSDKAVRVMNGPKDLSGRIMQRYERLRKSAGGSRKKAAKRFLSKTYDVTQLNTQPVTYDVEAADDEPVQTDKLKKLDLEAYIINDMKRYFGADGMPDGGGKTAMDDDDEDEQEDEYDEDELDEMTPGEVRSIAKGLGIKLVDKDGEKRKKSALIRLILKKQ